MARNTPAADRLLDTAGDLFCREGIRSVGIDRIIAEANVAKATLYQAFGSKDALVVAYLTRRDADDRRLYRAAALRVTDPAARVLVSFDVAIRGAQTGGYLGCAYLNALTEFPDADGAVARAVGEHRAWVRRQWADALTVEPDDAVIQRLQIAYDGGLLGSKAAHGVEPLLQARALAADILDAHRAAAAPRAAVSVA